MARRRNPAGDMSSLLIALAGAAVIGVGVYYVAKPKAPVAKAKSNKPAAPAVSGKWVVYPYAQVPPIIQGAFAAQMATALLGLGTTPYTQPDPPLPGNLPSGAQWLQQTVAGVTYGVVVTNLESGSLPTSTWYARKATKETQLPGV